MSTSGITPKPEEYIAATEQAFTRCPSFTGLRLLSAAVRFGFLTVRFEGPLDDYRGPYGAVIRLPEARPKSTTGHTGHEEVLVGSVEDWAHGDLTIRTLEAYASSRNQKRPYSSDGVWWLTDDHASSGGNRQTW